jgi:hypothetical protein
VHLRQQRKTVIATKCNEMGLASTMKRFETFRHDTSLLCERIAENSVCVSIGLSHPCAREKAQGRGTEVSRPVLSRYSPSPCMDQVGSSFKWEPSQIRDANPTSSRRAPSFPLLSTERVGNLRHPTLHASGMRDYLHIPCPILSLSFWRKGGRPRRSNARIRPTQRAGIAVAFSFAILPFGPTTNGNESAFQFPSSSRSHVFPSSRLMSEPFVPTVNQIFSESDHWTAER